MHYVYHDGGRAAAGFKGETGDCVVRAIAIATGEDYSSVYYAIYDQMRNWQAASRSRLATTMRAAKASPRDGVPRSVYEPYLYAKGWRWTATMHIGSGCQMRLDARELPNGPLIVRVSKHMVAVIDGTVFDTYDPTRAGQRCVYGFFSKPQIWSFENNA
jgi:hypothetical protein